MSRSPTIASPGRWETAASTPSAQAASTGRGVDYLILLCQLLLALAVVYQFAIEERRQLPPVFALAAAGFALHYWLPMRFRLPAFLALSLASLPLVLPWQEVFVLLGLGLTLVLVARLPVSLPLRVALLLLLAGNLALWRWGSQQAFWPVLGAMFMFRLMLYVFDTRDGQRRELLPSLSYFFLLPNACFTLFPVIDYSTYRRGYYEGPEREIYRTGMQWICRGLAHLLLYRWIKYHLLPAPYEIQNVAHLALFLAANYALYLRVSGQFHLITGLLHLFGFRLPRTHHCYFLASSFTDIWRRINIYWKDFMQKMFFLPVFFRLRRWGIVPAMLAATAAVFMATWLLHSYQTFWLLGDFPLTRNDALLWLSVGVLVAVGGLADFRRARAENEGTAPAWSWTSAVARSLKTLGVFAAVSVFWARWTHPDLVTWERLRLMLATQWSPDAAAWLGGAVLALVFVGTVTQRLWPMFTASEFARSWPVSHWSTAANMGLLGGILLLGQTELYRSRAPQLAQAIASLQQEAPTPLEAGQLVQGYYEEITNAGLQSDAFTDGTLRGQAGQHLHFTAMTRPTDDLLELELIPSWRGELSGATITVNRWGMRDRELAKEKPPGTYRVALVGSSIVMGYGVNDDEVFGRLLEAKLNAAQPAGAPRIELLNFGAGRHDAIQRRLLIDRKVMEFQPDAIYYFAHQDELFAPPRRLAGALYHRHDLHYQCLEDVVRRAGIGPHLSWGNVQMLLAQRSNEILLGLYHDLTGMCRRQNVLPVWIYLPMPGIAEAPTRMQHLVNLAGQGGFVTLDLADWADAYASDDVMVSSKDYHPNAHGHRVIAQRLFDAIGQRGELLPAFTPRSEEP